MRFTLKDIQKSTARISSVSGKRPVQTAYLQVHRTTARRAATGVTPHDILWAAVRERWGTTAVREFKDAVPNRRYRIDIAFPVSRLALEVDGWSHHGMFKADFIRDRERQNLLCIYGWRILRFTAGMIYKDLSRQVEIIAAAITPSADLTALTTHRRMFASPSRPLRGPRLVRKR